MMKYDIVVVGSEPAGIRLARAASQRKLRVALITTASDNPGRDQVEQPRIIHDLAEILENSPEIIPDLPSRRESFDRFSRNFRKLFQLHRSLQLDQLREAGVELLSGEVSLSNPHELLVQGVDQVAETLRGDQIVLSCASRQRGTVGVRCNGEHIVSGDQLLESSVLPSRIVVVGGGMIGRTWAELLSQLGGDVILVEGNPSTSIPQTHSTDSRWQTRLKQSSLRVVTGNDVIGVERGKRRGFSAILDCGLRIPTDIVLAAHGRIIDSGSLGLSRLGIQPDERGRIWCDSRGRSWSPSIRAVGQAVSVSERLRYESNPFARLFPEHSSHEVVPMAIPTELEPALVSSVCEEFSYIGR